MCLVLVVIFRCRTLNNIGVSARQFLLKFVSIFFQSVTTIYQQIVHEHFMSGYLLTIMGLQVCDLVVYLFQGFFLTLVVYQGVLVPQSLKKTGVMYNEFL